MFKSFIKTSHLQEGSEGGSWELQASRPDLNFGVGHGVDCLECDTRCVQESEGIRPSKRGFMKGRSCLTNLISFYDLVTRLVDEGKAVDVVYLDFNKAFDMVSYSFLPGKQAARVLDRYTLLWVRNWLEGCAQQFYTSKM